MLWRVSVCVCGQFMSSSIRLAPISPPALLFSVHNPTLGCTCKLLSEFEWHPKPSARVVVTRPALGAALRDISASAVGLRPLPKIRPRMRSCMRTSIDFVFIAGK